MLDLLSVAELTGRTAILIVAMTGLSGREAHEPRPVRLNPVRMS